MLCTPEQLERLCQQHCVTMAPPWPPLGVDAKPNPADITYRRAVEDAVRVALPDLLREMLPGLLREALAARQ